MVPIESIRIENFKSIRDCTINGCKRINLFIGKPNVGKSNIIEALSLFSSPYLKENSSKKLSQLIRLENETELFYNGNINRDATISTNIGYCKLGYNVKSGLKIVLDFLSDSYIFTVDEKLNVRGLTERKYFQPPVKRYNFKENVTYKRSHAKYLIPPFGFNLLPIIEQYEGLKSQVINLFREYNLELAFDKGSQTIKVIQDTKDGIFLVPYNSIADTLQRIIFYKAAIISNNDSVLLLEEPEAHSFPPYMAHLTQEIIHKYDNQYFVATHSPFILNNLLENSRHELSVYMVDYKDKQTVLNHLSDATLHEVLQYGVDLFTNSESYGFGSNT